MVTPPGTSLGIPSPLVVDKARLVARVDAIPVTRRIEYGPGNAGINGGGGRFWDSPGTLAAWNGVSARLSVLLDKALAGSVLI